MRLLTSPCNNRWSGRGGRGIGKLDGWVRTGSPEEEIVTEDCNISKEMQELQKQWHSVVQIIHSNANVVAFMNSRVGQYLDDHPFVALSLLMFIAVSAIPVAFFLIFVVTTAVMACIGVIVMEGVVIAIGGIALLCVLCGLGAVSLGVSGVLSISYIALSTLVNYWCSSRGQLRKQDVNGSLPQKKPGLDVSANNGKSE
ncbi:promethin [Neopelma chrysocephalum]|uniref:promethin n=1 Tax=Neopelma chrysocephalum TaxID=114329 RepID=UPI000FCD2431|nr:promethin [Neopelma chrysocephalum]